MVKEMLLLMFICIGFEFTISYSNQFSISTRDYMWRHLANDLTLRRFNETYRVPVAASHYSLHVMSFLIFPFLTIISKYLFDV